MKVYTETFIGKIPVDWEVGRFLTDLKIQGRIGWKGYTTTDLVESGPIVIGGTEIKSKLQLVLNNVKHLSREKYEESPEIMLKSGDVLLVTRGNLGEVGYYHSEYGEGTINPSVIILKEFVGNSKFLFYYLVSKRGNQQVLSLTSGSSIPAIYQSEVYKLYYPKPNLKEQNAIVDLIISFDQKIELLQTQNKTLEETAETIFKEWFGKYKNEDELPKGWKSGKLEDVIEIKYGKDHKHLKDGNFPLYGSGGIMRFVEKPLYEKESILIPRKGTLSNLFYLSQPFWSVDTMFYSKILKSHFGRFTFLFLKTIDLSGMNVGSAVPSLTTQVLNQIPIIIPADEIVIKFDTIVQSFYQKLESNNLQIQTLTKTRDELLPRLMSGEVRVKM
jgi:type I restriction enzyme S subunit